MCNKFVRCGCNSALYASLIVPCFTWLTCTQGQICCTAMDVLTVQFCILTMLLVFCQVFVTFLYHMQCTVSNLNKLYLLKIRTCIEIIASNTPLPPKKRCFKCKINLKLMPISFAVVVVVQQENWYLFSRGRPWHWSRYWRTTDQQRNIQTANLNMWCTSLHMLKNLWRILEARILKIL